MKNEFVPYKEALALKELGFDYCCFCSYSPEGKLADNYGTYYKVYPSEVTIAPLFQQAFRWFREKYNLVAEIQAPDGKNGKWNPTIHKSYGFGNYYDNDGFNSYEEAELACLRKLIEIKSKKNGMESQNISS